MTDRTAIVGSIRHSRQDLVACYVADLPADTVVVSGGAASVDAFAEEAAQACGLNTLNKAALGAALLHLVAGVGSPYSRASEDRFNPAQFPFAFGSLQPSPGLRGPIPQGSRGALSHGPSSAFRL